MENEENQDERESSLPAPQPLEENEEPENKNNINEIPEEFIMNSNKLILENKIPYDEKMKKTISQIESISNSSYEELKCEMNQFKNNNNIFLKEISLYRDNIISKYSQLFNLNEKPSQDEQKNSDCKSEIEKHIKLMERIHDIYSQIIGCIKQ